MRPATLLGAALALACLAGAAAADDGGWTAFVPEDAGFSVLVPVAPTLTETSTTTSHTKVWLAKSPDQNFLVTASVCDYFFRIDPKKELAMDEKNFLSSLNATSTDDKLHEYPGPRKKALPATTFHFKLEGYAGKSTVVVDGDTAFQIAIAVKDGFDASVVTDRFFDSFKLLPRKRKPAAKAAPAPKAAPAAK